MTRWTAWISGSRARPRAGSARRACSPPSRASATWWRRRGWARSAPPRTGTSPPARSWPPGSRSARGTTSAPASASTAGPGTPAPTSSRCWCRPPGPRSGSGAAAGPVQPAGPPVRRGQEPGREEEGDHRDRAHPAQDRLPGPQDRHAVPGTGRGLLHPAGIPRAEAGLAGTPAAKAPPRLRHHHHHRPAGGRLTTRRLTTSPRPAQPRSRRQPGTPALPPDKPASLPSPRHPSGQGSLPRAHRGPSYRVRHCRNRQRLPAGRSPSGRSRVSPPAAPCQAARPTGPIEHQAGHPGRVSGRLARQRQ